MVTEFSVSLSAKKVQVPYKTPHLPETSLYHLQFTSGRRKTCVGIPRCRNMHFLLLIFIKLRPICPFLQPVKVPLKVSTTAQRIICSCFVLSADPLQVCSIPSYQPLMKMLNGIVPCNRTISLSYILNDSSQSSPCPSYVWKFFICLELPESVTLLPFQGLK